MRYTVTAHGISKSFGNQLVLDRIDLSIPTGSVLALLGPNGAGKTTMVRVLATLIPPDAGSATIAGHDLLDDPIGVKRAISLTGQYAAVDDLLTGSENLELMARLRRLPRKAARARAEELLAAFGLSDARSRRVSTYSGGMRRRLDLAISMIERPQLLVLDEPSTGLDPTSREQLWATVRSLVDEGVTILLTTQYLEEADRLADAILVIDHGRVVARGSAEELKAGVGDDVLRLEFADVAACRAAGRLLGVIRNDEAAHRLDVRTDGSSNDVLKILGRLAEAGIDARRVTVKRPNLDDVFRSLTGTPHDDKKLEVA
ncbi:MAG TPA: ATP-binding cassette domain-containing protein [Mycobacteriales bacterium]|nr:ATP-binding cassette domain-containing protein [Mycobacteriales bacterium]